MITWRGTTPAGRSPQFLRFTRLSTVVAVHWVCVGLVFGLRSVLRPRAVRGEMLAVDSPDITDSPAG